MAVQTSMDSEDFRMAVLKGNTELVKQWLTSGSNNNNYYYNDDRN